MAVNLNATTPAAPSRKVNVTFQSDSNNNISGYVDINPFGYTMTDPNLLSSWAWLNQNTNGSTNTVVLTNGRIVLTSDGGGDGIVGYVRNKIAATFTITAAVALASGGINDNSHGASFGLLVTDGTKRSTFGVLFLNGSMYLTGIYFSAVNTGVAALGSMGNPGNPLVWSSPVLWLRIIEDATHRTFQISPDGTNWLQAAQEGVTNNLTTSKYGLHIRGEGSNAAGVCYSFTESTP